MDKKFVKRWVVGDFSFKRLLRSVVFVYACVCVYGYFFTEKQIFQPQISTYQESRDMLKLTSANGKRISAVYLPNAKASFTVLYSHGNAEDLGDIRPYLQQLHRLGFSVFAYDYQGYGTSEGTPSEQNAYADINAAYNYLTQSLKISPARIIVYGRSVGSGPSVDLASRERVAGLILESAFVSAFRVVTKIPILPFDKFANIDKIGRVRCPVLVMHGTADDLIPLWHGEALFKAANPPKHYFWVEGGGHNDLVEVAGERYDKVIQDFGNLLQAKQ
ncbi:alpha/beta hydrolase [Ancylothrix sp. C2]|uniref:alpha/beta hydrolase n=1 Tax=Ancylothrix sp. D3o TaxID=2953691 RepID=UPI0021BB8771|nr:alpha/beta hydrolase [Ancylothrix sp. D3o]MCT7948656.1 alpha/beta hydrolase [Ancylothrix sp. D3o]